MFAQKVKGIMVDLDRFYDFCIPWYKKYNKMVPYFFERITAEWIMKQGLVPNEHSLFENSLRKIYGRDFFDARDVMPIPYGYSCYGDLDGDIALCRMPYLSQDPISMFKAWAGNVVIDAWKKVERATDKEMWNAYMIAIRNEDIDGIVDFDTEMCEKAMKYIPKGKFCTVDQIKNVVNTEWLKIQTRKSIMSKPYKK